MDWRKQLSNLQAAVTKKRRDLNDLAVAKQVSRSLFQQAVRKAESLGQGTRQTVDQAAEATAKILTEWTGQEVTATQVKRRVALGAAIGTVCAAGPLAAMALRQARAAQIAQSTAAEGSTGSPSTTGLPSVSPTDPNQAWDQDDIEYERSQYEHLQDHIQHNDLLDAQIDDHISYNDALDVSLGCDFD